MYILHPNLIDFYCVMFINLHCKLLIHTSHREEEVSFSVNTGKPDVLDQCTSFLCTSEPNHMYSVQVNLWASVP